MYFDWNGSQDSRISESLLNSECHFPSNCVEPHNFTNHKKFNAFFFFIETVWKEMSKMINCTAQNKWTGDEIGS